MSSTPSLIRLDSPPDLVDRVYRALLDAISEGTLPPGHRVRQESVAEQLAVSRQPVLQALRQLKNDGFLRDAPGRGLLVAPLDVTWMQQVYQVRGALDVLAAQLAAQRQQLLDPGLIERGRQAAAGRDVQAMIDADLVFHQAIYAASGNAFIGQTTALHWRHLRRVMGAVLQSSTQRQAVWDEHEAIAQAIAQGNGRHAAALIGQHSQQASQHLAGQLTHVLQQRTGAAP